MELITIFATSGREDISFLTKFLEILTEEQKRKISKGYKRALSRKKRNKCLKRCSTLLITKEMKSKIKVNLLFIDYRLVDIKKAWGGWQAQILMVGYGTLVQGRDLATPNSPGSSISR